MSRIAGRTELAMLSASLASRRAIAREAFEAYDFGVRIESGPADGFFFATHDGVPVMARKIVVFADLETHAKAGWFCVAFEQGTTNIENAFAYTDKNSFYGHLPDDFAPGSAGIDPEPEPSHTFM